MAKIKRPAALAQANSTKKLLPLTDACQARIESILKANGDLLSAALEELVEECQRSPNVVNDAVKTSGFYWWPLGRSDLLDWADVMDKLDDILKSVTESYGFIQGSGFKDVQQRPFSAQDKRMLLAILNSTAILLENTIGMASYACVDHLSVLLLSTDVEVLEAVLRVLCLPFKRGKNNFHRATAMGLDVELLRVLFDDSVYILDGSVDPARPSWLLHETPERHATVPTIERMIRMQSARAALVNMEVCRLLSLAVYLEVSDNFRAADLFKVQPTIISDTARILTEGQGEIAVAAMRVIRACFRYDLKWSEIDYALSVDANHGPLMSILRAILDDPGSFTPRFLMAFFDLLEAMGGTGAFAEALVASGLIETALDVLAVASFDAVIERLPYRIAEKLLILLDAMTHKTQAAADSFFANEGLSKVIGFCERMQRLRCTGQCVQATAVMHVQVFCLRLVHRLLTNNGADDRMRVLIDGPMFRILQENYEQFAGHDECIPFFTKSVLILADYIHNEPTTLSILQEQGITAVLMEALCKNVLPDAELVRTHLHALSALCLNQQGYDDFSRLRPLHVFLRRVFGADEFRRVLLVPGLAMSLGSALDEFARHHPSLRPQVLDAMIAVCSADVFSPVSISVEEPMLSFLADGSVRFEAYCYCLEGLIRAPTHAQEFEAANGLVALLDVLPGQLVFNLSTSSLGMATIGVLRAFVPQSTVLLERLVASLSRAAKAPLDEAGAGELLGLVTLLLELFFAPTSPFEDFERTRVFSTTDSIAALHAVFHTALLASWSGAKGRHLLRHLPSQIVALFAAMSRFCVIASRQLEAPLATHLISQLLHVNEAWGEPVYVQCLLTCLNACLFDELAFKLQALVFAVRVFSSKLKSLDSLLLATELTEGAVDALLHLLVRLTTASVYPPATDIHDEIRDIRAFAARWALRLSSFSSNRLLARLIGNLVAAAKEQQHERVLQSLSLFDVAFRIIAAEQQALPDVVAHMISHYEYFGVDDAAAALLVEDRMRLRALVALLHAKANTALINGVDISVAVGLLDGEFFAEAALILAEVVAMLSVPRPIAAFSTDAVVSKLARPYRDAESVDAALRLAVACAKVKPLPQPVVESLLDAALHARPTSSSLMQSVPALLTLLLRLHFESTSTRAALMAIDLSSRLRSSRDLVDLGTFVQENRAGILYDWRAWIQAVRSAAEPVRLSETDVSVRGRSGDADSIIRCANVEHVDYMLAQLQKIEMPSFAQLRSDPEQSVCPMHAMLPLLAILSELSLAYPDVHQRVVHRAASWLPSFFVLACVPRCEFTDILVPDSSPNAAKLLPDFLNDADTGVLLWADFFVQTLVLGPVIEQRQKSASLSEAQVSRCRLLVDAVQAAWAAISRRPAKDDFCDATAQWAMLAQTFAAAHVTCILLDITSPEIGREVQPELIKGDRRRASPASTLMAAQMVERRFIQILTDHLQRIADYNSIATVGIQMASIAGELIVPVISAALEMLSAYGGRMPAQSNELIAAGDDQLFTEDEDGSQAGVGFDDDEFGSSSDRSAMSVDDEEGLEEYGYEEELQSDDEDEEDFYDDDSEGDSTSQVSVISVDSDSHRAHFSHDSEDSGADIEHAHGLDHRGLPSGALEDAVLQLLQRSGIDTTNPNIEIVVEEMDDSSNDEEPRFAGDSQGESLLASGNSSFEDSDAEVEDTLGEASPRLRHHRSVRNVFSNTLDAWEELAAAQGGAHREAGQSALELPFHQQQQAQPRMGRFGLNFFEAARRPDRNEEISPSPLVAPGASSGAADPMKPLASVKRSDDSPRYRLASEPVAAAPKQDSPVHPLSIGASACMATHRRWAQLARAMYSSGLEAASMVDELRREWNVDELPIVASVPGTSDDDSDEEEEEDDDLESSSVGEDAPVFEDRGIDPSFLEAMPFDLLAEAFQQHFVERRRAIRAAHPEQRPRIRTSEQFLQSLPEETRQLYERMSREEDRSTSAFFDGTSDMTSGSENESGHQGEGSRHQGEESEHRGDESEEGEEGEDAPSPGGERTPAAQQSQASATGGVPMADPAALTAILAVLYSDTARPNKPLGKALAAFCRASKRTRDSLLWLLLYVLQKAPSSMDSLHAIFAKFVQRKTVGMPPASPRAPLSSISTLADASRKQQSAIVQRTLQLLMSLVRDDVNVREFFSEPAGQASMSAVPKDSSSSLLALFAVLKPDTPFMTEVVSKGGPVGSLVIELLLHLVALILDDSKQQQPPSYAIPEGLLKAFIRMLASEDIDLTPRARTHAMHILQRLTRGSLQTMATEILALIEALLSTGPASSDAVVKANGPAQRLLRLMKLLLSMLFSNTGELLPEVTAEILRSIAEALVSPSWTAFIGQLASIDGPAWQPLIEVYFLRTQALLAAGHSNEELLAFGEQHRRLLNDLIQGNPKLLTTGSLRPLTLHPDLLDFENKRILFKQLLHKPAAAMPSPAYPPVQLNVRRQYVFEDSFHQLMARPGDQVRFGKLNVKFHGEEGVDVGGVTREWFSVLTRAMFNADYALFCPSTADRVTHQPNSASGINPDHLQYFRFIGRVIGKAIYDGRLLDAYFTRSFYRHILGQAPDMRDLESIDPEYYKSLAWILQNDITGVIEDVFAVETEQFGQSTLAELVPHGASIAVTEENKRDYVRAMTEFKLTTGIKAQIEAFLVGFHEVIPAALVALFSEAELELLISGLPEVDIEDWRAHTEYHGGFTPSTPVVQYFWRAVRNMEPEDRAKVLQFSTGTSKVPMEGFVALQGSGGVQRFQIHRAPVAYTTGPDGRQQRKLPTAHTCFNQLDLPEYASYEELRDALMLAVRECSTGFGFV